MSPRRTILTFIPFRRLWLRRRSDSSPFYAACESESSTPAQSLTGNDIDGTPVSSGPYTEISTASRQAPTTRWRVFINSALFLVTLSAASYGTSFLRERYFYHRAYGTHVLDKVELTMSGLAVVSNIAGMVLAFMWVTGRFRKGQVWLVIVVSSIVAIILAPLSLLVAECLGIIISYTIFLVAIQRASDVGRQSVALLGALSAVIPTLVVWNITGTRQLPSVLLGYLAGASWQASIALASGIGSSRQPSNHSASLLWPLVYMAALQVDGIVDQLLFLRANVGWVGAAALARNVVTAATVTVVGPLSSQALAGRLKLGRTNRLIALSLGMTGITVVGLPIILPIAISGGAVHARGYDRILELSVLYALSIPFSTYWQVHTRAAHAHPELWRSIAYLAVLILAIHVAVVMPLLLLKAWRIIPLGTLAAFAVGTVILRRLASTFVAA